MSWRGRKRGVDPKDALVEEVSSLLKKRRDVRDIELGSDFSLRVALLDDRSPVTLFLDNLFTDLNGVEGEQRANRLERFVAAGLDASPRPKTWDQAAPRLLPAVRSLSYAAAISKTNKALEEPFLPFISRMVAVDDAHGMSFVGVDDLRAWTVSAETVAEAAASNLQSQPPEIVNSELVPHGIEVVGPDGYVTSWLTAASVLDEVGSSLAGDVIAFVPDRDRMLLVGSEDDQSLLAGLDWAMDTYRESSRQLSPAPYIVHTTDVAPWLPPRTHRCWTRVDKANHVLAATEYAYQGHALEQVLLEAGQDVYVAAVDVRDRDDGTMWSYTLWIAEVTDSLMPMADYIAMARRDDSGNKEVFMVPWAEVERLAGASMHPEPEFDPPRWRVHAWPPDSAINELRQLAVDPPTDSPT